MHFGEYELSPSLIGLSLLHSTRPEAFQRLSVRASIPCYRDFTLDKCRSLGFASAHSDSTPCSGSLSLRRGDFAPCLAGEGNSQAHYAKGTPSHEKHHAPTACRRMVSGSLSPSCSECFSPFPHGTGTLSVSREYLALPDGPGGFTQDSSCPALLRIPLRLAPLRVRRLSCSTAGLSRTFRSRRVLRRRGPTPRAPERARFGLLPGRSPLLGESLFFFFSCGY